MQAEGEVVLLQEAAEAPRDFRAFYADEDRRLFKTLYFVTGDRNSLTGLSDRTSIATWSGYRSWTPEQIRPGEMLHTEVSDSCYGTGALWTPVQISMHPRP